MTEQKQPRILVERAKVYRRVPKTYKNKDCNAAIYKSFARFPVKNPHWLFETIEYQGHEFLLNSIQEVAYDSQGRIIHFFLNRRIVNSRFFVQVIFYILHKYIVFGAVRSCMVLVGGITPLYRCFIRLNFDIAYTAVRIFNTEIARRNL